MADFPVQLSLNLGFSNRESGIFQRRKSTSSGSKATSIAVWRFFDYLKCLHWSIQAEHISSEQISSFF